MELKTKNGYTFYIDDEDVAIVSKYKWYGYTPKRYRKDGGVSYYKPFIQANDRANSSTIRLHRLVMNAPKGTEIDHIDGDRCNNRKRNLRCCTGLQNKRNRSKNTNNTSGFKGVTWHKKAGKWEAQLQRGARHSYLGLFERREEAARAYNKAALEWHGEFAKLNEIKEEEI